MMQSFVSPADASGLMYEYSYSDCENLISKVVIVTLAHKKPRPTCLGYSNSPSRYFIYMGSLNQVESTAYS